MQKFHMFDSLSPRVLANIDEMVMREVTPYIKTMAALPQEIQEASVDAANTQSVEEYSANLVGGWHEHNKLAVEIDQFLVDYYAGNETFTSSATIEKVRAFIQRAFATEKRKRIYSAGVKLSIETGLKRVVPRYNLDQSQILFLLSCWRIDFWRLSRGMHAEYELARREGRDFSKSKSDLLSTFHAQEEVLLDTRFVSLHGTMLNSTDEQVRTIVSEFASEREASRNDSIVGGYLIIERSDLKAIQKLVDYDNRQEYLFGSNLYGMPDLFLRKEVVKILVDHGLLDLRSSVVFYSEEELDSGLNQLEMFNAERGLVYGTSPLDRRANHFPTDYSNNLWGGVYHDGPRHAV